MRRQECEGRLRAMVRLVVFRPADMAQARSSEKRFCGETQATQEASQSHAESGRSVLPSEPATTHE